ncbi:Aspartyl protease [Handroanthus impetiginosus]|uniref:Aspartyl protease n=1 Tax=Handroanthus impetiginosus TaxID=429701 RepID=A0A2G9GGZ6_9LAMI|nr:Aspartyl protease [Handroanthus impetiginosus]
MSVLMSLFINLSILTSFAFPSTFSLTELNNDGFSTDLIHRDSLISPLHNSSSSHWNLISKAIQRSRTRADCFAFRSCASGALSTELMASHGEYLMKISIGMPPFEVSGIVDTGGVLSWMQCAPCITCCPQKQPLFTPGESLTYKVVPSNSKLCKSLGGRSSILGDNTCRYSLFYLDHSYSNGVISTDTVTIDSGSGMPLSQRNFVFGCGYENFGIFSEDTTGVIGLWGGPYSLFSQMNNVIGGKFSYCLVSHAHINSRPSKIHFGNKSIVSGASVVSTGLHIFEDSYAVRFKGITVGRQTFIVTNLSNSSSSSQILGFLTQRILVDSGTLLTHLPEKLYNLLGAAMRKEIQLEVADPTNRLRLCYKTFGGKMRGPIVMFHFVGANVKLYPINTFLGVSKNVHCLGFVPHDGVAILGNLAQRDFLVGFDLGRKIVSFKRTDCTKQ